MSGGVRGASSSTRSSNRITEQPQPSTSKRLPSSSSSSLQSNDHHITIHNEPTASSTHRPELDDPFTQLCAAITTRLQLTSQCMLLLTRILNQLSRSHNPSTSSLLPSLHQSLSDADATHSELLSLYDRLVVMRIDKDQVLDSRVRKDRRRQREVLEQQVRDVSSRYNQIKQLAHSKLHTNRGAGSDQDEFTSTIATYGSQGQQHNITTTSAASRYTPYSATHDDHQPLLSPPSPADSSLPATYQTSLLLDDTASVQSSQQELYDMEADAIQRSVFIEQVECDVSTLHEMFIDMHSMVSEQGSVVSGLEAVVGRSAERVRDGLGEVLKAEEYGRKRRGRMCCCWMFGGLLLSVLVLVLYALGGSAG